VLGKTTVSTGCRPGGISSITDRSMSAYITIVSDLGIGVALMMI
jgi:hypothetical protein